MAKHPRLRPTAQSTIKKSGASQSWICAASGSRKRPHKTCYECKSCEIQSRPCSVLLHEHEHCTSLCCLSIFLNSTVEKIVSAYLYPKAITGFKISWWRWNIWEAYNVFHTCKTSWVWKVSALLLSLLTQLRREKPDVETALRHHACPHILVPRKLPSTSSIIIFALEEEKKSVQLLNRNLISTWLLVGCPPQVMEHNKIFHRHCSPRHTQNQQERDGTKNFLWHLALPSVRVGATWGK